MGFGEIFALVTKPQVFWTIISTLVALNVAPDEFQGFLRNRHNLLKKLRRAIRVLIFEEVGGDDSKNAES